MGSDGVSNYVMGDNDLFNNCPGGMVVIKLCPGVKFSLQVIHSGVQLLNGIAQLR